MKGLDSTVRRALLTVESDILKTEDALASAQEQLAKAESAQPFDLQTVINAEVRVEGYQQALKRAQAIKARLFPAS